ncbi:MAG: hypothetical protein WCK39_07045 [Methanomassiliicoccales archaeon]
MSASVGSAQDPASKPASVPGACPKCGHVWSPKAEDATACSQCGHRLEPPRKKKGLLNALRQFNEDANDGFV